MDAFYHVDVVLLALHVTGCTTVIMKHTIQ